MSITARLSEKEGKRIKKHLFKRGKTAYKKPNGLQKAKLLSKELIKPVDGALHVEILHDHPRPKIKVVFDDFQQILLRNFSSSVR